MLVTCRSNHNSNYSCWPLYRVLLHYKLYNLFFVEYIFLFQSNSNQTQIRRRDHLYKVLVIGDLATGKTSIIKRYVHRFFSQNYRATIGVDFALKVINWDENTVIRLQLWDIAGKIDLSSYPKIRERCKMTDYFLIRTFYISFWV